VASIIDTVANVAKRRGFVFQAGEIYGGTKSAWDYGPLGVELKENIKRQWWRSVVTGRDDVVGLDSSIILPREVWVASGHVEVFHDPLVESLIISSRRTRPSTGIRRPTGWPTFAIPTPVSRVSGPSRANST
jgi:glycyl-tRNA synthetase